MMPENASIGSRTINPARQEFRCLSQSGTAVDQAAVPAHHARLRGQTGIGSGVPGTKRRSLVRVPCPGGRPCREAAGQGPILFDLKGFDRRNWKDREEARDAVYANRRRVRGRRGRRLQRRRGEMVERPFAHLYETGGMRRVYLRGHPNILSACWCTSRASTSGCSCGS